MLSPTRKLILDFKPTGQRIRHARMTGKTPWSTIAILPNSRRSPQGNDTDPGAMVLWGLSLYDDALADLP
jgi:hypothetical protein